MFWSKNKNKIYPCIPQFCYIKVGFKGVHITRTCFPDDCTNRTVSHRTYRTVSHRIGARYHKSPLHAGDSNDATCAFVRPSHLYIITCKILLSSEYIDSRIITRTTAKSSFIRPSTIYSYDSRVLHAMVYIQMTRTTAQVASSESPPCFGTTINIARIIQYYICAIAVLHLHGPVHA